MHERRAMRRELRGHAPREAGQGADQQRPSGEEHGARGRGELNVSMAGWHL